MVSTPWAQLLLAAAVIAGAGAGRAWTGMRMAHRESPAAVVHDGNLTRWFVQRQDHFDTTNTVQWQQRYFVNDTFFDVKMGGPVFVCVGGEGPPLDSSVVVDGGLHCAIMVHLAQALKGLIVAVEHRYYGISYPTPDFSTANMRFLTSQQALADLAAIHDFLVDEYSLTAANPFLSFGGSYPGMMASWFHLKYPDKVFAAVASSAPVYAQVNFQGYNDVVAASLSKEVVGGSPACLSAVQEAFAAIGVQLLTGSAARRLLEAQFNVCDPTTNPLDSIDNQNEFVQGLSGLFPVQGNDPSCTSPLCNIALVCAAMLNTSVGDPVASLAAMAAAEFGPQCLNVSHANTIASLTDTSLEGGVGRIWFWETCNEFAFYQTCDPGSDCPFTTMPHLNSLEANEVLCQIAFNITPAQIDTNVAATNEFYGGLTPNTTRLLFVNGEIDPWHFLSVNVSRPGVPSLWVPGASHHFWTHVYQPTDLPPITLARQQITAQVYDWLGRAGHGLRVAGY